jgi:hypothetical protein
MTRTPSLALSNEVDVEVREHAGEPAQGDCARRAGGDHGVRANHGDLQVLDAGHAGKVELQLILALAEVREGVVVKCAVEHKGVVPALGVRREPGKQIGIAPQDVVTCAAGEAIVPTPGDARPSADEFSSGDMVKCEWGHQCWAPPLFSFYALRSNDQEVSMG